MVSTITQSTPGYSDAHRKSPGLVNWAKQDKHRQNKIQETRRRQEGKKDYAGYPSEPVKRRRRNNQQRELHWVPQEFTNTKQGSKLVLFSKHRQCKTKQTREGKS